MTMPGRYCNAITVDEINSAGQGLYEAIFSEQVLTDGKLMNQSFNNLVDAEVLVRQESGREVRIAFKYERFSEHLVGSRISAQSQATQTNSDFTATWLPPFLLNAIPVGRRQKCSRARHVMHGSRTAQRLCFTDQQDVKEMMVAVLVSVGRDRPTEVTRILGASNSPNSLTTTHCQSSSAAWQRKRQWQRSESQCRESCH